LLIALALIATASGLGLWVNSIDQIRIVMILAGVGNAAQFSAAYPLLYQLVPREEAGFYTGLQSTALSIATPLTSIVTGLLVNGGGYRRIFLVCSLCVVGAIVALLAVKRRDAPLEIAERERILSNSNSILLYPGPLK
jgi:MFS family permease